MYFQLFLCKSPTKLQLMHDIYNCGLSHSQYKALKTGLILAVPRGSASLILMGGGGGGVSEIA